MARSRSSVPVELVTFDCYGTLVDWRLGISRAFREAVPGAAEIEPERFFEAYAVAETEVESGSYRPYREVLAEAGERAARRLGLRIPTSRRHFLSERLPSWPAFADTGPALERLADTGVRLGILSNVDEDLLAGTLHQLPVRFDDIVTAERVRSYKPALAHFRAALEALGGPVHSLVHVAESCYHDVAAAVPLGIRTVWVNRTASPPCGELKPAAEVRDLSGAVDWILSTVPLR